MWHDVEAIALTLDLDDQAMASLRMLRHLNVAECASLVCSLQRPICLFAELIVGFI
jgi:hypothetical protein